jgi:hypothetical protein
MLKEKMSDWIEVAIANYHERDSVPEGAIIGLIKRGEAVNIALFNQDTGRSFARIIDGMSQSIDGNGEIFESIRDAQGVPIIAVELADLPTEGDQDGLSDLDPFMFACFHSVQATSVGEMDRPTSD